MRVAVMGASPNPERYSNRAIKKLIDNGHRVIPINPNYPEVEGITSYSDFDALDPGSIDTVTMYLNPERTRDMAPTLIKLKPKELLTFCNWMM